jgi:hypothetical protein
MTVPRIFKFPIDGASLDTNVPSAVPVANPLGRAETVAMYFKYSSAFSNSGNVSGVSCDEAADNGLDERDTEDAEAVKEKELLVDIRRSRRTDDEGAHIVDVALSRKYKKLLISRGSR